MLYIDSLLGSQSLQPMVWDKNIATVWVNRQSCMALLDKGAQINTIIPGFIENHSLDMGPLLDLMGG